MAVPVVRINIRLVSRMEVTTLTAAKPTSDTGNETILKRKDYPNVNEKSRNEYVLSIFEERSFAKMVKHM